jgi:hypothetical protein
MALRPQTHSSALLLLLAGVSLVCVLVVDIMDISLIVSFPEYFCQIFLLIADVILDFVFEGIRTNSTTAVELAQVLLLLSECFLAASESFCLKLFTIHVFHLKLSLRRYRIFSFSAGGNSFLVF